MLGLVLLAALLPFSTCMSLQSLKSNVLQLSKQLWQASLNAPATEHERLVAMVTELENARPVAKPTEQLHLLDGLWRTVYSDLNILSLSTLPSLTYNALPDPSVPGTEPATVKVQDVYQAFSSTKKWYNNHVEFHCNGQIATIATLGKHEPCLENPLRINFEFYKTFVNGLDASGVKGAKEQQLLEHHESSDLRQALKLNSEQKLEKDLAAKAWVDISYIDESADLRVMRFGTRFYVLERV